MRSNVGVWLDHRCAFIVIMRDGCEETNSLVSDVEKHVRYSGGRPEDQVENRFTNHLNEYYAKVIAFLHDADAILLFGPGEAKGELQRRLSVEPSAPRIVVVETVDKMTDQQIIAKVRDHFRESEGGGHVRNAGTFTPESQKPHVHRREKTREWE